MLLRPEEPGAGNWRAVLIAELLDMLLPERPAGQRVVVAIDGRSSSGKTTLAQRMASVTQRAAVVHTDDVAWWHSRFDWVELLLDGILEPFQAGRQVMFRPPGWKERGRDGAINISPETSALIVEGVGSPEEWGMARRIRLDASGPERHRQAQRRPDHLRRDDLRRCGGMDEGGDPFSRCRQAVAAGDQDRRRHTRTLP